MSLRDNVRLNRTKMLDEGALNHVPQHFSMTLVMFLIVYFASNIVRGIIEGIATVFCIIADERFFDILIGYSLGKKSDAEFSAAYDEFAASMPWWLLLVSLLASGAMIAGAIIYCKFIEKRSIASLGIRKSKIGLEYGAGAIIGLAMYALTVLIAYLCGSVTIGSSTNASFAIILFLVAFVIQGASEEIMVRGYLMVSVARDYKVALAVVFSSAIFSFMHLSNPGVTGVALLNIFIFGVFEAIYILKRGDIFGACAIHTMWNFAQGNIFGSSVSGMSRMPSLLEVTSNPDMVSANGGSFGLEGGFAATIVILIAIAVVLLIPPKKSELPPYELNRESFDTSSTVQF